jgi:uracil-DNA glycosylase family 4
VDARDRLRQYLEQRRELGESEYVLDSLSVEDALKSLGMRGELPPARPSGGSSYAPPAAGNAPPSAARQEAERLAQSGDWREALRAVGADQPGAKPAAPAAPAPSVPVPPAASRPIEPSMDEAPKEKVGRYEMPKAPAGGSTAGEPAKGLVVGNAMGDMMGPLAHLDSLDAVAKAVAACKACGLHSTAMNAVPGEGNPKAGFVCVGEAPGASEDESGRPFVGAAGQLLTKILEAIQLKREDVFICNVLKHRPPGNRNPALDEITACSPFLLRQLELLQPKVILALGTFAAQTLLQTNTPMGKLRGQVHRFHGVPLIVTYHPAALLRNPNWKRPTWEDVQLARRIFDGVSGSV